MPKQLNPSVRLRIIQIRASRSDRPPTIDVILEQLATEYGEDQLPSRGTVGSTIKGWEALHEDIRYRDMPFEWHQLERARVPWEASEWVTRCALDYDQMVIAHALPAKSDLKRSGYVAEAARFTNRVAAWCWRVHQVARDLSEGRTLQIARFYAYAEQMQDLLPNKPAMEIAWLGQWLRFRPDQSCEKAYVYVGALMAGVIEPVPSLQKIEGWIGGFPFHSTLEKAGVEGIVTGLWDWLNTWPIEKSQVEGLTDARTPEATIQG